VWPRGPHGPGACPSPSFWGKGNCSHHPLGRNPSSIHGQVSTPFCTPVTVHRRCQLSDHLPSQAPVMAWPHHSTRQPPEGFWATHPLTNGTSPGTPECCRQPPPDGSARLHGPGRLFHQRLNVLSRCLVTLQPLRSGLDPPHTHTHTHTHTPCSYQGSSRTPC